MLSLCSLNHLSQIFLLSCSKIVVLNCQQTLSILFLQILIFLQIPSKKTKKPKSPPTAEQKQFLQRNQGCYQKVLCCPFLWNVHYVYPFLVKPEATLCSIDKGEAVLLHLCACVTLGGVWTTAGFDFCSPQLGTAVVMCLYFKMFLTHVVPFPFPVAALRPHSQRPQRCLGQSRAPRSSI